MIFKFVLFYESLNKSGCVIIWLVNVQSLSVDEAALAACENIGSSSESTLGIFFFVQIQHFHFIVTSLAYVRMEGISEMEVMWLCRQNPSHVLLTVTLWSSQETLAVII